LDGALCPLLNDADLLSQFYVEESLRHTIKQFCKRTAWPGKPAVGFAIDPAKLQELLLSLFNTPAARQILGQQSATGRYTYLDNAIWQWVGARNPKLGERISRCCDEIKDRLFMKLDLWTALLGELQNENPDAETRLLVAYITLAFAMLQPDDRYALSEAFLAAFPEYTAKFGGLG